MQQSKLIYVCLVQYEKLNIHFYQRQPKTRATGKYLNITRCILLDVDGQG